MTANIIYHQSQFKSCQHTTKGFGFLGVGGMLSQAHESFKAALRNDPNNSTALVGLALCYRGKQEHLKSLIFFEKAYRFEPDNLNIFLQYCLTKYRYGQNKQALSDLLNIIDMLIHDGYEYLCWDTFFSILHAAIYDSESNLSLKKYSKKVITILTCCPNKVSKNIYCMVFQIYEDHLSESLNTIEEILKAKEFNDINKAIELLAFLLDQLRIGKSSKNRMLNFINGLKPLLRDYLINTSASEQILHNIISILIKIRDENIHTLLKDNSIDIMDLPIQSFLDLLFYSVPEIKTFFQKNTLRVDENTSAFYSICRVCFLSKNEKDVISFFHKIELINELKRLNTLQQNNLLFQVHQAHFNLISTGYRAIAILFVRALAELNFLFFGTYDQFYRAGKGYFTVDWVSAFGHLIFLEILLRLEKTGEFQQIPKFIACSENEVANKSVIELLRSNGFEFIDSPKDEIEPRRWQMAYIWTEEMGVMYFMDFMNISQKKLLAQPLFSVLNLPNRWINSGVQWLEERSIHKNSDITVIHCRESSFWRNLYNTFLDSRNVDPQTYQKSIEFLLDNGDVVIRIGDIGMSPIKGIKNNRFLDLTQKESDYDWLVFFLLYRANRFIGTNSGPAGIANIFNKACLLTNWFPLNVHISNLNQDNLVVPKTVKVDGKRISLNSMLIDPLSSNEFVSSLKEAEYTLVDLTGQELLEATREFYSRQEKKYKVNDVNQENENQFQYVWREKMFWKINVPHCFLEKYADVLTEGF